MQQLFLLCAIVFYCNIKQCGGNHLFITFIGPEALLL